MLVFTISLTDLHYTLLYMSQRVERIANCSLALTQPQAQPSTSWPSALPPSFQRRLNRQADWHASSAATARTPPAHDHPSACRRTCDHKQLNDEGLCTTSNEDLCTTSNGRLLVYLRDGEVTAKARATTSTNNMSERVWGVHHKQQQVACVLTGAAVSRPVRGLQRRRSPSESA